MKPSGTRKGSKKNVHDPKIIITGLFRKKSSEVGNVSRAFSEAVQSQTIKKRSRERLLLALADSKGNTRMPRDLPTPQTETAPNWTILKGSFQ